MIDPATYYVNINSTKDLDLFEAYIHYTQDNYPYIENALNDDYLNYIYSSEFDYYEEYDDINAEREIDSLRKMCIISNYKNIVI